MTTSIIIPTYNGVALLGQCVSEIRRFTEQPYEIIVVDDGSSDATLDYCLAERLILVRLPVNRGFPVACNAGLRVATGETIVLLNNDIVVSRRWLSNMTACLYSSPQIGIVGPMTNYASGEQQFHLGYGSIPQFHEMTLAANRPDASKRKPVNRLVGMCFMLKRELLERVGEFDERYAPGHYEDDDYCYRARQQGYQLMVAGDTYVHHHGSASFKAYPQQDIADLVSRNRTKFTEKFGVDPLTFV